MIGGSPDTDLTFLGLLQAVCTSPEDDTPRLVLADYWSEHDQEARGEFVRVQCELAAAVPPVGVKDRPTDLLGGQGRVFHKRGRESAWGKRQAFLRRRERELWDMSLGWTWPFDGAINWFSRGFVSSLTCTAADWLAHADALAWHQDHSTAACPPTAQPITKVVLAVAGDIPNAMRGGGQPVRIRGIDSRERWPWIAFEVATLHPRPLGRRTGESEDDHVQRVEAFNDQVGST